MPENEKREFKLVGNLESRVASKTNNPYTVLLVKTEDGAFTKELFVEQNDISLLNLLFPIKKE